MECESGKNKNIEKACMRESSKKVINRSIISFCQTNKLIIENTYYNQSVKDKYTFLTKKKTKSIIDNNYKIYTEIKSNQKLIKAK